MPTGAQAFQQVLSEAIDDLLEHGFDSVERIQGWTRRLHAAAEASLVSASSLDDQMRDGLAAIYRKLVERGQVAKFHPGIARFTLERIRPALRAELDRRIVASAGLIRLNREQAIDQTLRRFAGWSTSIPAGGSDVAKRGETRKDVRKSMAGLPFVERRVLIDQGHKLAASISQIVASDGGAIAGAWRSNYRQPNYNYREDHKERDGLVFLIRDSWAHAAGLVKPGEAGFYDRVTAVGEEPFCFPGDVRVSARDVVASYRRWYDGDLCTIHFLSGPPLKATPNHPIMTARGWVAAGALNEGDYCCEIVDQRRDAPERNHDNRIPCILDVHQAIVEIGRSEVRMGNLEQFHGDGSVSNVDIVRAARPLSVGRFEPSLFHRIKKLLLAVSFLSRASASAVDFFDWAGLGAAASIMSGGRQSLSSISALSLHAQGIGHMPTARLAAGLLDDIVDDLARDTERAGNLKDAGAALVDLSDGKRVARIERSHFAGHVFNLQTESGWYIANGIKVHNCRCYMIWKYNLRDVPLDMLTAKGRAALGSAQGLEEVRSARFARADDAGPPMPKASKAFARYVGPLAERPEGKRCDGCSMFVPRVACTSAEGLIDPGGYCRFHEPAPVLALA